MLEKRIALPFLGKGLSQWMYRTSSWLKQNPRKAGGLLFLTAVGWIWFETNVVNKDKILSPNVNNHLVYDVKRVKADDLERSDIDQANIEHLKQAALQQQQSKEFLLTTVEDPVKQAEMKALIKQEDEKNRASRGAAMVVKSGQLYVREPHWNIRNSERNWMIMSRDQQQQKDHYWYRVDRSRDDDYARNTYSK